MVSVIALTPLHLLLNGFDDLRPDIFQERLKGVVTHLTRNGNNRIDGCSPNLNIFIVNILDNIINSLLIVFAQLILTHNFANHFQPACQDFRRLLPLVRHGETLEASVLVRQLVNG